MSPLKHSQNVAARMGRWSAGHRKTAIFGWLAFVVAAFAVGIAVPLQSIDETDWNVGEARQGDHIIRDGGFALDEQSEFVLVQSGTRTVDDAAFRAVVNDALVALRGFDEVTKLRSPLTAGNEGQISEDRHSALIQFSPEGSYDDAVTYIDSITAATEKVQEENPGYYVGQAGSASTGKALDEMFTGQLARAGLLSIPLTLGILLIVFGSLVGASVPLLLALTSVFATLGLVAIPSQFIPGRTCSSKKVSADRCTPSASSAGSGRGICGSIQICKVAGNAVGLAGRGPSSAVVALPRAPGAGRCSHDLAYERCIRARAHWRRRRPPTDRASAAP